MEIKCWKSYGTPVYDEFATLQMKSYKLLKEIEAINKIDNWAYEHSVNDDYKEISNEINLLQKLAYQSTIAKWIGKPICGYATVRCSNCKTAFEDNNGKWKYCPECGYKME